MSSLPQFDILRSTPCSSINPERVQNFLASVGMGSTGLFAIVVLGPVVVRSILWWQKRRRQEEEQRFFDAVMIPAQERKEGSEESLPLIIGENPDYHGDHDPTNWNIPPSGPPQRHSKPVRHLRIHSLDELPPPTMDDVTPPHSPWSCPASPVPQPEPPKERPGRRRSPFNPIVPGMKTTWEEGVDPVTGRRWRRKLVVYAGPLETPSAVSLGNDGVGN